MQGAEDAFVAYLLWLENTVKGLKKNFVCGTHTFSQRKFLTSRSRD